MTTKKHANSSKLLTGFTIIELLIVMAIIAILSGIILFSIIQYISSGKDANISGNLSVLVPVGEIYYNNSGETYSDFCDSEVVKNAFSQMPKNFTGSCYDESNNPAGACCGVSVIGDKWAACARKFANSEKAFCVDSRGIKREIVVSFCQSGIMECK